MPNLRWSYGGREDLNIAKGTPMSVKYSTVLLSILGLLLFAERGSELRAQTNAGQSPKAIEKVSQLNEADQTANERRAYALSLVTSLAEEARSYNDLALRPRVMARAADLLWDSDRVMARGLFIRAWEAAVKGDAEGVTVKTKDGVPPMVMALRRMSGNDLRSEVLALAARRDRVLGEEFLAKLKDENRTESENSKPDNKSPASQDGSQRLQLAAKLLDDGQIERALEFAAPALDQVNASSIGFLSALRLQSPEAADQRFAFLLARTELDPASDANTISGLSSYAFSPGFYVTFSADGSATWRQGESINTSPANLASSLRNRFLQVASSVLLRPLLPPDQDFTSAGRTGKYMVIKRLLPLFDQYMPDSATALRAQLATLTSDPLKTALGDDTALLTNGLRQEETTRSTLEKMQDRIDHARNSRERDLIYADAAVALAGSGEMRAQDFAEKMEDSERRGQVRQYVDLELVRYAVRKKDATKIAQLARIGQLTHTQRAWVYLQLAQLLPGSDRQQVVDFLEVGLEEVRRVDGQDSARTGLLIGVASQLLKIDTTRGWEIMTEAVKAANSTDTFTGEDQALTFPMMTRSGIKFITIGGKEFSLSEMFRSLTKDDLYRSTNLAKSLKNDGPRAVATLAIARATLVK
jgi:hypothetical protein